MQISFFSDFFFSKSETMVLSLKRVGYLLWVGSEILPQVEDLKFTSDGRKEQEMDRRTGAASAVVRTLYWSVVVKRAEPKGNTLFTRQSLFLPSPMVMNCG